jgi:carboxyl-terminal processing protease
VRGAGWLGFGRARQLLVGLGLVAMLVAGLAARRFFTRGLDSEPTPPAKATPVASALPLDTEPDSRALALPSGAPTRISCEQAQRVAAYLQSELAAPPVEPVASELASAWGGMLDPHGLWSAAPDSPLNAELATAAPDMLASLYEQSGNCAGAERVAGTWQSWQLKLLAIYDAAYAAARHQPSRANLDLFGFVAEPVFEDDPVTRPATELSRELGARLGAFVARFPEEAPLADQARSRFFPTGSQTLTEILILAALRAYVPLVDPHGDFAPLDEEWALYAGDDTLDAGSPLWGEVTRTPLGARIVADPAAPLELDDLVLAINGLSLAGASIDQVEQAARSPVDHGALEVRVLRQGEPKLLTLRIADEPADEAVALAFERIPYGRELVLRVIIPDVGDHLGQDLADTLAQQAPGTSALLLDLRGNGGGSLDAAVESLGLFLPGAKLFPLVHRGAVTEVLEAPRPEHPYLGPVAALVDGDTASAAEMLAGALQAYGRGTLIGARTFGKGCVQEYFDDVVDSGVLRLTTLQFVMPNGKPLQQIGLTPELTLPLPPAEERESQITRQPITFGGPDVRDRKNGPGPAWPRPSSAPGPCADPLVCSALLGLSGVRPGGADGKAGARAARPRAGTR